MRLAPEDRCPSGMAKTADGEDTDAEVDLTACATIQQIRFFEADDDVAHSARDRHGIPKRGDRTRDVRDVIR